MCCKFINIPFSLPPTRLSSSPVPSDGNHFTEKKGRKGPGEVDGNSIGRFIPVHPRPLRINWLKEILSVIFCFVSALGFTFLVWWIFS